MCVRTEKGKKQKKMNKPHVGKPGKKDKKMGRGTNPPPRQSGQNGKTTKKKKWATKTVPKKTKPRSLGGGGPQWGGPPTRTNSMCWTWWGRTAKGTRR